MVSGFMVSGFMVGIRFYGIRFWIWPEPLVAARKKGSGYENEVNSNFRPLSYVTRLSPQTLFRFFLGRDNFSLKANFSRFRAAYLANEKRKPENVKEHIN
jgi:hypothetical protein